MSLLSLDEARQTLKIDDDDASVDAELQTYCDAITTVIENYVGQVIDQRVVTERVRLRGSRRFVLKSVPVMTLTSLTGLTGTVYPLIGLDLDPDTGVVEVFNGSAPAETVVITYTAGFDPAVIPENYKRGAAIILQHIWESQRGRGSGNVLGGVIGDEERLNRTWMYEIPRKALEWLGTPMPGVG